MPLTRRNLVLRVCQAGSALFLTTGAGRFLYSAGRPQRRKPAAGLAVEPWRPAYHRLAEMGELAGRAERARALLAECRLCPRQCGVDRLAGRRGFCRTGAEATVFSRQPHFGEELPLVGRHGSGTIFFSSCNLRCVFCQNWPIAHEGRGARVTDEQLAAQMLDLQRIGCRNINLVTPTHVMPNILNATWIAWRQGLRIPLCYNTGGYDAVEAIRLLDGVVDIYLPDLKFMDGEEAFRYAASARDYPARAQAAIVEMHRQVGDLITDAEGNALRGVMLRHLVMPNRVAGTRQLVAWVAENLSRSTYVNIMAQYRVEHRAFEHPHIARAITPAEYLEAMAWAEEAGLTNLDERSLSQARMFRRRR